MTRPRKCRRVCGMPKCKLFGSLSLQSQQNSIINMTVEEYEAIRLIDLEGLSQEDCAESMNVARTTVQRIYCDARKKLAQMLVNGTALQIEGGDYRICEGFEKGCHCTHCRKKKQFCEIKE